MPTEMKVATPFKFPNGRVAKNRLAKAAMTEGLADPATNLPNEGHCRLYKRWAEGGLGVSITGNVQVDKRYLEAPRNVVMEKGMPLEVYKKWAEATKADGCLAIVQLSHAGRQCPSSVCTQPIAPSAVPMELAGLPKTLANIMTRPPREMTAAEIDDVVVRFGDAAKMCEDSGFDGVQIHGAHGYLISQFLSARTNLRTDKWGGDAENRASLLMAVIDSVRSRVSDRFIVMVKVNSADFKKGGFTEEESLALLTRLQTKKVDAIEISGGTYEQPEMLTNVKESTRQREAFFLEFAKKARKATSLPLMLTGGFASLKAMESALETDIDLVGIARPVTTDADSPKKLINGTITSFERHSVQTGIAYIDNSFGPVIGTLWHGAHLQNLAASTPSKNYKPSIMWILNVTMPAIYMWDPAKNKSASALGLLALGAASVGLASFFGLF